MDREWVDVFPTENGDVIPAIAMWLFTRGYFFVETSATWRIIPISKWLVTPIYKPWNAHL